MRPNAGQGQTGAEWPILGSMQASILDVPLDPKAAGRPPGALGTNSPCNTHCPPPLVTGLPHVCMLHLPGHPCTMPGLTARHPAVARAQHGGSSRTHASPVQHALVALAARQPAAMVRVASTSSLIEQWTVAPQNCAAGAGGRWGVIICQYSHLQSRRLVARGRAYRSPNDLVPQTLRQLFPPDGNGGWNKRG